MKKFDLLRRFAYDLERLQKIKKALHSLDEAHCNYGLSKRQETREANLAAEAQKIAETYGLIAYHQGDPRGCSLYLITKELKANGQYSNGIAI